MIKEIRVDFVMLVALVPIPWANKTIEPGTVFGCPKIAVASLFARKQAREATTKDFLVDFLASKPTSDDIAGVLEHLELDSTGNKETRLTRLTAYMDTLEEPGAR